MSVLPVGIGSSGGGYSIANSLRFRSSASAYLSRTPGSAGNRKTWTWSGWVKRGKLGATLQTVFQASSGATDSTGIYFENDNLIFSIYAASAYNGRRNSTAVYRDHSAHLHVIVAVDTTQATAGDRIKLYVNGAQLTAFGVSTDPTLNTDTHVNNTVLHRFGDAQYSTYYFDGLLSEIYFIDGQALTPSSFGETNADGVWVPKKYTGTYGTNGFWLPFSDGTSTTTLGYDQAGSNDWTLNNFSLTAGTTYDWMTDTPTNNYATLNPLAVSASTGTMSEGNLKVVTTTTNGGNTFGSIPIPSSGTWWWEVTLGSANNVGLMGIAEYKPSASWLYDNTNSAQYATTGYKYVDNVATASWASTSTNTDVIGILADSSGTISFYKQTGGSGNFSLLGSITHTTAGLFPCFSDGNNSLTETAYFNFGQRPFNYVTQHGSLPSSAKALCTANLPTVAITRPTNGFVQRFQAYNTIASDLAADRSGWSSWVEMWFKVLHVDNDNKFRFSDDSSNQMVMDAEAKSTWVAPASGNWFGCAIRAEANYGVVTGTYIGDNTSNRNISHSLSGVPEAAIVKDESTGSWYIYHKSYTGVTYYQKFETIDSAESNSNSPWGTGSWLSSTFMVTNNATNNLNANGVTYRYILFKSVPGYLSVGSWSGNSSTDGPLIHMGFRPGFVYHRNRTSSTIARPRFTTIKNLTYNPTSEYAYANDLGVNGDWNPAFLSDILSVGMKRRTNLGQDGDNTTGQSYWYIAFAEHPFGGSNVSPAPAR